MIVAKEVEAFQYAIHPAFNVSAAGRIYFLELEELLVQPYVHQGCTGRAATWLWSRNTANKVCHSGLHICLYRRLLVWPY